MATKIRASNLHTDVKTMVTTLVGENALDSAEANLLIDAKFTANSTDVLSEGSTNLYFTNARADARIAAADTGDLSEGSNLYYTDARADARAQLKVDALVGSAPGTLDTLQELGDALGDDPNFATTVTNSIATKLPLAGGTMTGNITFGDNNQSIYGTGADLRVFHSGVHSFVQNTTGNMYLQDDNYVEIGSSSGEVYIGAVKDGAVNLRYDNVKKIETTSTGINVTGTVTSDGLTVDASGEATLSLNGYTASQNTEVQLVAIREDTSTSKSILDIKTNNGTSLTKRARFDWDGDISFYEGTGTTAKFFWDASAESLGIGTTSPAAKLDVNGLIQGIAGASSSGGLKLHTNSGINVSANYMSFHTGQTNGFSFNGNSDGADNSNQLVVINSSGNVGIGTSNGDVTGDGSSSRTYVGIIGSGNRGRLNLGTTASNGADVGMLAFTNGSNTLGSIVMDSNSGVQNTGQLYISTSDDMTIRAVSDITYQTTQTNASAGHHIFKSYNTEIMRIDGGNNRVGIGTTNPTAKLHVEGTFQVRSSSSSIFNDTNNAENVRMLVSGTHFNADGVDKDFRVESNSNGHALFMDAGAASGGDLLFGVSSRAGMYNGTGANGVAIETLGDQGTTLVVQSSTNSCVYLSNPSGNTNDNFIVFSDAGSTVGSISGTSSGTTYNTTSDRRLKDNIEPISDATDKLMDMKPVTHTWIDNPEAPQVHGFIAQEMQEVIPEAVSGDAESDEMMSMDYGRITPVIVAALQNALKEIKELKTRIDELENN